MIAALLALAAPVAAQISLPGAPLPEVPDPGGLLDVPLGTARDLLQGPAGQVTATLRQARLDRLDAFIRINRASVERDLQGQPARRGMLLLIDPDPATLAAVAPLGFVAGEAATIPGLELSVVELVIPAGLSLAKAEALLRKIAPQAVVATDQVHFQSGSPAGAPRGFTHPAIAPVNVPVGIIDGAPAQPVASLRGFASGAPLASNHGSAVAALAAWAGARRLMVADVYGSDPAGGGALAIARALGWLVDGGARVVSISLVGPRNPLVERAVRAAMARGVVIVAAVGNDGAAAPPAFPASYPGVLAITGVDRRNRPLIEAGWAEHLDYAAPGADLLASDARGRAVPVRGTSFAAPLVAVRAALALERGSKPGGIVSALDAEAIPLSRSRPDPQTGRGLVCGVCR